MNNKMNSVYKHNVSNKNDLKQKIDREISLRKEKRGIEMYKKFGYGLCAIAVIGLGIYYLTNDNKTLNPDDNNNGDNSVKEVVLERNLMKSAEYNVVVYNEIDEYLQENNILETADSNKLVIDTAEIVTNDNFATCSGTVTLDLGVDGEYTYTVASNCTDDDEGAELIIKRYNGINNINLGELFSLVKVEDGYVGLFGIVDKKDTTCYTRPSDKEYASTSTICSPLYDGAALVKISEQGDLEIIDEITKSEIGYNKNLPTQIIETDSSYFVELGGTNGTGFLNLQSILVLKYTKDFKVEWIKEFDSRKRLILIDNSLGLVSYGDAEADKLFLLDNLGNIEKEIQFTIEDNQKLPFLIELVYSDNYFYTYINDDADRTEDDYYVNKLYKFDKEGNLVYAKEIDYQVKANTVSMIYVNDNNIFLTKGDNITRIYDLEGNAKEIYTGNGLYTEGIITNKDNYTFVIKNGFNFVVDSYDKDGLVLKSDYSINFDIDAMDNSKGSRYLATPTDLVKYNYSLDNEGTLLMLIFK